MVYFGKLLLAAVASGAVLWGSASNAGIIYDNIPPLSSSGGTDPVSFDGPAYNSFSTGGTTSQLLDVKLILSATSGTPSNFTVSLLKDSSSSPGTLAATLGTFDDSTLASTPSVYDISLASASIDLAANARYWIEVSGPNSVAAWEVASNVTGAGIANEFSAYTPSGVLSVSPNSHSTPPYLMQISTTQSTGLPPVITDPTDPNPPGGGGGGTPSVPEPGTFLQTLSAIAIGGFEIVCRRMIRA
jgi:hypothetical protein